MATLTSNIIYKPSIIAAYIGRKIPYEDTYFQWLYHKFLRVFTY